MTTDDSHIPAHTANTVCPIKSQLIQWVILLILLVSVCATIALTGLVVARLSPRGIDTIEAVARS